MFPYPIFHNRRGSLSLGQKYWQQVKQYYNVAYYPTWEPSGTVATDISGKGRNVSYAGTPGLGAVGIGDGRTCANINGLGYITAWSAGLAGDFNGKEGLIGMWLAANDAGIWADTNAYYPFHFTADASNATYLRKGVAGDIQIHYTAAGTDKAILADRHAGVRWIHFGFQWSYSGAHVSLYFNGTKQRPTASPLEWAGAIVNPLTFGAQINFSGKFPGRMAHVGVGNVPVADSAMRTIAQTHGQIIFIGDSRTSNKRWCFPAVEAAYTSGLFGYGGRGVANWGVSGYAWANIASEAATTDALLQPGENNVLVCWAGVNMGTDTTAAQIYARISAYCAARRAAGWKVVICSEIDAQDATRNTAGWHSTVYPELNVLLAADHSFADGYADLGANANLQDATNTTYFDADKVHLTAAGYTIVGGIITSVLVALA